MITIRIDGTRELAVQLDQLPRRMLEEIDDATDTIAGRELRDLATYPAPPSASTYVRTLNLARGWAAPQERVSFGGGGFSKSFSNTVDYAHWVQGEDQAWMHQERWDTAEDIHARYQGAYEQAAQGAVDRAAQEVR